MHWLTQFGTLALPQYEAQFSNAPAPVAQATVALIGGGAYDAYGSDVARQRYPALLSYACVVASSSQATAVAQMAALKALLGTKAKLWRTEADGTSQQWCWARLTAIDDTMRVKAPKWLVPVTLEFTLLGRWNGLSHGGYWVLDDGEYLDDGLYLDGEEPTVLDTAPTAPQTITVTNNGNQAVRDAVIRLTSAASANTYLSVTVTGVSAFSWTGTLAATKTLEIDTGRKTVLNDGVAAWNGFLLLAEHKTADWLVLEPGDNDVIVETDSSGPNSTIQFIFDDGWV